MLTLASMVPAEHFVWLQALRILAVGSILKVRSGDLPASFGLGLGIPDTIFGLSALGLALSGMVGLLSSMALVAWNLLGAAILLAAPLVLQLGLPGRLQTFKENPDGRALFAFPMALAPTLIAPLFPFANILQVAGLLTLK
jgi:hypothetical protein